MVNSRAKGVRGELMHRDVLRNLGHTGAERGQQHCGNPDAPDVKGGIPHTHPEVKYMAKHSAEKYMRQAERDAGEDQVPYIALRQTGVGLMDEIIGVRAKDFDRLCRLHLAQEIRALISEKDRWEELARELAKECGYANADFLE